MPHFYLGRLNNNDVNCMGNRGMQSQGRRRFSRKKGGHKGSGRSQGHAEPLLEQPVAEMATTVPCPVCAHPVDPKRLHFHMVRFHGASMRPKPAPPAQ
jgi:hypothetical protein